MSNDFYLIPTNKRRNSESVLKNFKNDKDSLDQILEIREIAHRFIKSKDERDFKIEELFNYSVKESWLIKKSMNKVMNELEQDEGRWVLVQDLHDGGTGPFQKIIEKNDGSIDPILNVGKDEIFRTFFSFGNECFNENSTMTMQAYQTRMK